MIRLNKQWLKAAAVRAVRTFAQTLAASLTVGATLSDVNWGAAMSVSTLAALASVLTSLAGLPELNNEGDKND